MNENVVDHLRKYVDCEVNTQTVSEQICMLTTDTNMWTAGMNEKGQPMNEICLP